MTHLAILSQTKEGKRYLSSAVALLEHFFGLFSTTICLLLYKWDGWSGFLLETVPRCLLL